MNNSRLLRDCFLGFLFVCAVYVACYAQGVSGSGEAAPVTRPSVEYTAGDKRDPFKTYLKDSESASEEAPEGEVEIKLPELVVNGIIWGGKFPQAIINDKVVKVGDEIEGAKIKQISKDGVVVLFSSKTYTLPAPAMAGVKSSLSN